jgi:hypothetical protein
VRSPEDRLSWIEEAIDDLGRGDGPRAMDAGDLVSGSSSSLIRGWKELRTDSCLEAIDSREPDIRFSFV